MDAAERALLDKAVQDAVEQAAPHGGAAVDNALGGLGWLEMLAAEPVVAVEVVFRALGTAGAAASVLDDVLASALGMEPGAEVCVALPPFALSTPPGTIDGGQFAAAGLATGRVAGAESVLVVCADGAALSAVSVLASSAEVHAVQGLDPAADLHALRVAGEATTSTPLDALAWESAVARGRVALGHQIAGACRTMLDLARGHALERMQFNRPIARFQAVRHRLAEAFLAVEALDAVLTAAGNEPGTMTAALAKAQAGRTARTVGAHCQQVLAGVGFTAEHPFHRFLKRTMVLDGTLGRGDDVARDIGRRLLADRHVPTLVEL